jgi:hypothetical protein
MHAAGMGGGAAVLLFERIDAGLKCHLERSEGSSVTPDSSLCSE